MKWNLDLSIPLGGISLSQTQPGGGTEARGSSFAPVEGQLVRSFGEMGSGGTF